MPLTSPVSNYEPESGFFNDTVTYSAPSRTPILSPIPGKATVGTDKSITITSGEGTYVKFENVGIPSVSTGSNVNMGGQLGYTGDEKLKFTAYDKSSKKLKVSDFLKNTDPASLAAAGGAIVKTAKDTILPDEEKKPKETDLGISTKDTHVDATDRAGFRLATGIGLAPFHLTTKAFGLDKQKESQNRKENLIKEEIDRIKKLMK